ncbi:phosphatidylserine/phosphatidylglycerophosphate/cardiolipin synthase family protein [Nocardioides sp.]|uniref:phospholipase D-like domain-containing protein n=1 Tax=Nocardioides sp. TaxID=35761 RepID=UPI0027338C7B|nr:phospholipase D-like domain-containing protein [Nocardioides sp.]MDP3893154.1 phospholipase D-like domain-containing protein [Nocardioides sp.]
MTFAPAADAKFRPQPGITFNDPLGGPKAKQRINNRLLKAIRNTGKRQQIRVHSWNIRHKPFVDSLIKAHKKGVSVRVIIWQGNANSDNPNPLFNRLKRELKRNGNKKRTAARKSGTRRCFASCRGTGGLPHSKYFMFSKVNGVKHVVMYGGHNATSLAATHQWNEIATITGRERVYNDFLKVFNQSYRDKPVAKPWVETTRGTMSPMFHPHQGPGVKGDPIRKAIRRIGCKRAGRAGINGRTKVRIAMTSWHGERGARLAHNLVRKQNQGCNVKIVYAVMGNEVLRILRREGNKPVRLRQITQDFNGDGVYDRYLHTKVMTVQGRWRKQKNRHLVWSGSSNWSPMVLRSDEADVRIENRGRARTYANYVDRLYGNPPRSARMDPALTGRLSTQAIDPYANIEVD